MHYMETMKGNKMAEQTVIEIDNLGFGKVRFEELTLNKLQFAVQGLIEIVHLPKFGIDMVINEEGKFNGMERNEFATALWLAAHGVTEEQVDDCIVGPTMLIGLPDSEGNSVGLSQEQMDAVYKFAEGGW